VWVGGINFKVRLLPIAILLVFILWSCFCSFQLIELVFIIVLTRINHFFGIKLSLWSVYFIGCYDNPPNHYLSNHLFNGIHDSSHHLLNRIHDSPNHLFYQIDDSLKRSFFRVYILISMFNLYWMKTPVRNTYLYNMAGTRSWQRAWHFFVAQV